MIQIDRLFIRAYSPSEQLIMLYLLLHADENGNVDFCERNISRVTEVSYKTCRTIHQRFKSEGIIKGAPDGAVVGAVGEVVTICDFDSYNVLTKIRAHIDGALNGALKEKEAIKETEKVSPLNPLQKDIENNQERENITPYNPPAGDGERSVSREEFEELKKAFEALSEENKKLREEKEKSEKKKRNVFTAPTEGEVAEYIQEKGYHFDATSFVSFYQSKGWMVGNSKMKDWKAACRTWEGKRNPTRNDDDDENHLSRSERFAKWATENCPHICDMEMPNDEQLEDMLRICDNNIIGCLDLLQDDHHTGSLYDLFKERFGGNR